MIQRHTPVWVVGFSIYCLAIVAIILYLRAKTLTRDSFAGVNMESTANGTALVYNASNDVNAVNVNAKSLDISERATIRGEPVLTRADLNTIPATKGEKGDKGEPGLRGEPGPPGNAGKNGAFDAITFGDKFRFSGVGDAHGDDDWLRMFNKQGTGYRGGIAMDKLWVGSGGTQLHGNVNIEGGALKTNTVMGNDKGRTGRLHIAGDELLYLLNKKGVIVGKEWGGTGDLSVQGNLDANNIYSTTVRGLKGPGNAAGRLHITGDELLYLLNKDGVIVSKAWGGNGNISVEGNASVNGKVCIGQTCMDEAALKKVISSQSPLNKTQVVHRRPVWGIGAKYVDKVFSGSTPQKMLESHVYGPFQYAVPAVAKGATRKYRMYAVYSDGVTKGDGPVIRFSILDWDNNWAEKGKYVDFQFPNTWGGTTGEHRDAFSRIVDDPKDWMHAFMYTFVPSNVQGSPTVRWQYAEIQTLDVYP